MAAPAGDTIIALASGPPPAAVAVVRISGPAAREALALLTGADLPPRRLVRATLRRAGEDPPLDEALAVFFPGPASFTGEDSGELHLHGSRAVVDEALEALCAHPAVRPAEPGEFTRRAFVNGKMDLVQAEGVADLVAAETRLQRVQAVRQARGALSVAYEGWRARTLDALALAEASLDFVDEDDVGETAADAEGLRALAREIRAHLDDGGRGERLREGFAIAVLGPPNAGKSSLVNALARRDVAIVSPRAGTTRDVIEARLDLDGWPVTVADTAGLREAEDEIEREGIRRARDWGRAADVCVVLGDMGAGTPPDPPAWAERAIPVWNKADLAGGPAPGPGEIAISCRTGEGLDDLLVRLREEVARGAGNPEAGAHLTRARHRDALATAAGALERAAAEGADELAAEELRTAAEALGRITGGVDVEDVLDLVFGTFCIGK